MALDSFSVLFFFVELFLEILYDKGKLVNLLWFFLALELEFVSDSKEFSLVNISGQLFGWGLSIKRGTEFSSKFFMRIIEFFNKIVFFEYLNFESFDFYFEGFQLMSNLGKLGLVEVFNIFLFGFELFDFAFLFIELIGDDFNLSWVFLFELWILWVDFLRLLLELMMGLIEGFYLSVESNVLLF